MVNNYVLKFVNGETNFDAFYKEYCSDETINHWLEDTVIMLANKGIPITYDAVFRANYSAEEAEATIRKLHQNNSYAVVPDKHFPTVKSLISYFMRCHCCMAIKRSEVYDLVFSILKALDPSTEYFHKYSDDSHFIIRAVPNYIDGEDASNYIEKEILAKLPTDVTGAKRIKICKEQIKYHFYIEGNKYPRWAQSAEWPMSKSGKPTKYLCQKRNGDEVKYYFLDIDTDEEVEVSQYY